MLQELIFIESVLGRVGPIDTSCWHETLLRDASTASCHNPAFGENLGNRVSLVPPARDTFFQLLSLLRELFKADSWVNGTQLQRRDWLAMHVVITVCPVHRSGAELENAGHQRCSRAPGTIPPAAFVRYCDWEVEERIPMFSKPRGHAAQAGIDVVEHRHCSFFARRSSVQLRELPLGGSGPADTAGSRRIQAGHV